jgi:hypothetical protein
MNADKTTPKSATDFHGFTRIDTKARMNPERLFWKNEFCSKIGG